MIPTSRVSDVPRVLGDIFPSSLPGSKMIKDAINNVKDLDINIGTLGKENNGSHQVQMSREVEIKLGLAWNVKKGMKRCSGDGSMIHSQSTASTATVEAISPKAVEFSKNTASSSPVPTELESKGNLMIDIPKPSLFLKHARHGSSSASSSTNLSVLSGNTLVNSENSQLESTVVTENESIPRPSPCTSFSR